MRKQVLRVLILAIITFQLIYAAALINYKEQGQAPQSVTPVPATTPFGGKSFLPVLLGQYQGEIPYLINECPTPRPGDLKGLLIPCDEG